MRDNVAETLGIRKDQVNIKATTEEGLGFTGSGEGIAAQAAACLETVENYSYEPASRGRWTTWRRVRHLQRLPRAKER